MIKPSISSTPNYAEQVYDRGNGNRRPGGLSYKRDGDTRQKTKLGETNEGVHVAQA